jgi:hypothetical protein
MPPSALDSTAAGTPSRSSMGSFREANRRRL